MQSFKIVYGGLIKGCGETDKSEFFCPVHDRLMPFPGGVSLLVEIIQALPAPETFFIADEELTLIDSKSHGVSGVSLDVEENLY